MLSVSGLISELHFTLNDVPERIRILGHLQLNGINVTVAKEFVLKKQQLSVHVKYSKLISDYANLGPRMDY